MRREFKAMESAMRDFIEQPDYSTMIVNASDGDVVFPIRVLQNWDRSWDTHIFLSFPFACNDAADYLQHCIGILKAQLDAGNREQIEQGHEPWPTIPLACLDERLPPAMRLQSAVEYVRRIMPEEAEIVWGLLPSSISDANGYKDCISALLAREGFEDWLEGHRFFVRDDRSHPFLLPTLEAEKVESVLVIDIDFSTERVADSLVSTVNDNHEPLADRMAALLQLAAFDFAYQRYDQALEKYDLLHSYYVQEKDFVGQASALGGAADVHLRAGETKLAKMRYQQALAVAVRSESLPVILNFLKGAGETSLRLEQFTEAEGYFSLASHVAGKLTDPYSKVDAMEKRGIALQGRGESETAAESWAAAKELSKQFNYSGPHRSLLGRLIALYTEIGKSEAAESCKHELATLDAAGR
jgi:tetratricopeptide (TPR) repeat protein